VERFGGMMRRIVTFVTSNWGNEFAVKWITNIMVSVHVGLGVAVLAGGAYRFPYPTYQPLIDIVNGETWIWGIWVLFSAFLMLIPARWPQIVGLWTGMCWQIMWTAAFTIAVIEYPTAGATAAVAYGGFALLDAALLTARIVERDGG
jgi:hypothetical protein